MHQDLESNTSKTYELKVCTFENGKPEEFLQNMKDFKTSTDGTGTTSATRKIKFLHTMLHGEALREFNITTSKLCNTTNGNLKLIKEVLLSYFNPLNKLNK